MARDAGAAVLWFFIGGAQVALRRFSALIRCVLWPLLSRDQGRDYE
jgi:hypothetical protein